MATSRPKKTELLELEPKMQPAQTRATQTYERILEAAAETLAEVGFERLSTNLVCQRAELTPPALYRYFPNKYALLHELSRRLMERQNAIIPKWLTPEVFTGGLKSLEAALLGLQLETYEITRETTGGMWIIRAMRAVPMLQEVRLASDLEVSTYNVELLREALPHIAPAQLLLISRVAIEMAYSPMEMLFDDPALEPKAVMSIVASALAAYFIRLGAAE
ncbi:TetR/AcrR family transcriptional regulator [Aquirhabdus parva]|uniref:TetR/AcrR family transcriptional regulator n=1 Tax=Aquirhabdus parva TaxID=2283318 RepID=A0A345P8H2_9GAMM|nr:TetR/AcrR family transcriptional regulator [Aquirhabdus parva]AXI03581.1 TetR/AcrR family transcriptional regulator [Aquirhabdus parva]